ncbi:hypothetical protein RND81_06G219300 [Saponaria officinalis]|uniref:protein-tyrosine-phosphatase n=1 Tax=Saponaria officinalis TaxID=3572 RepID=A0AAW1KCL8_SAPOF
MADHVGGESIATVDHISENPIDRKTIVYIWDMDETLILLKSLLDGTYAQAYGGSKDIQQAFDIGKMWEKLILDICDRYFFYEQIEDYNQPAVKALSQYDDDADLSNYDFNQDGIGPPKDDLSKRKLAYRHRVIDNKYKQGLLSILDQKTIDQWNDVYEMTDSYTEGWLSSARTLLQHCASESEHESINILVTSGSLIPSLVKCLLFRLDNFITSENVYSAWDVGKLQCFSWIRERFNGPNVQFCVIGDGWEECEAAEILRWPFVKIEPKPDGFHRFPGLTLKTMGYYLSVVYGNSDAEHDNQVSTSTVS